MDPDIARLKQARDDAVEAYDRFEQGQQESADLEVSRLTQRQRADPATVRQARKIGQQKWIDSVFGQGAVEDQMFAERRVQVFGMLITVRLLGDISAKLDEIYDAVMVPR